jgi:hypothetical protein
VAFTPLNCNKNNAGAPAGTTFVNRGAQTLNNVHVVLIFWGIQWGGSPNPLAAQVTSAVQNLLAGPYMTYLAQYGVHRGSLWGTKFVTNGDPPNPFSYKNVGDFIINLLDADILPEPDSNWPIFYCVIMPSNVSFQGDKRLENVPLPPGTLSKVSGANSSIIWHDYDLLDVDNDPAHYAWVGSNGSVAIQANVDYITTVLSHELVEACTDPNGGDGIVQVGGPAGVAQIGDPCNGICDYVRGVKVQSYWSQLDISDTTINPNRISINPFGNGGCVLPKFYSVRRTLAGRNIAGKISSLGSPIPSLNQLIKTLF